MFGPHNDSGYVERDRHEEHKQKKFEEKFYEEIEANNRLLIKLLHYRKYLEENPSSHPITHFEWVSVEKLNEEWNKL